jgi:hypothetical protein
MEAQARSEALRKITFRALWWFRWAAALTLASGLLMWAIGGSDYKPSTSPGLSILFGSILGITMAANVWMVIWPNQQINIKSAQTVADGGEADPAAAGAAKLAGRASRVNAFFSIPMLFFMVFAAHGALWFSGVGGTVVYWLLVLVLWAFIEGSCLGLIGGIDSPFNKAAFDKHQSTIWFGFGLLAILYFVGWELLLKA